MTSFRARAAGFSLLEVLVAFALLAAGLTLLLGALSAAARNVGQAEQRTRAVLHAESLLASAGVDAPLQLGQRSGSWEQGGYRWTLQVQPYVEARARAAAVTASDDAAATGPQLVQLELRVSWDGARAGDLQWRTLRLLPAPLERLQ